MFVENAAKCKDINRKPPEAGTSDVLHDTLENTNKSFSLQDNKYMGIILCLKGKFHNTKIYSYFCMELDTSRDCFKAFNFQRLRQFGFCPEYRTSHLIFFFQKHQFLFWRRSGYG